MEKCSESANVTGERSDLSPTAFAGEVEKLKAVRLLKATDCVWREQGYLSTAHGRPKWIAADLRGRLEGLE